MPGSPDPADASDYRARKNGRVEQHTDEFTPSVFEHVTTVE